MKEGAGVLEFSFDMVVYLLGLAATAGSILSRISILEKKVEKHNNFIERLTKVEERERSNSHRIECLEGKAER